MNNNFEEMLEEYESVRPRRGQIVNGEVLELTEDTVLLDVGAKRDAIVPRRELVSHDGGPGIGFILRFGLFPEIVLKFLLYMFKLYGHFINHNLLFYVL